MVELNWGWMGVEEGGVVMEDAVAAAWAAPEAVVVMVEAASCRVREWRWKMK